MPLDTPASTARNTPTPLRGIFPSSSPKVFEPKIIAKRYVVVDTIGQGGMGRVYRALDTVLTRKVAVKILPVDRFASLHYARFQQEAKAASHLDHPNIVKALDFGLTREGQPFFVMEHLEGETLEQMIRRNGRLTIDQFIEIFSQVCCAMDHAHREKVIHRDLKTTNVIVSKHFDRDGEYLKASILDFGIAKVLSTANGVVTQAGEVLGTPTYMSPEQAHGVDLDGRSDIYSLGCMMFEVLAGVPPFSCKSSMELIQKHLFETPPSLAEKANTPFPSELEMIVAKALEKDPAERYQTMFDLLMDIEHLDIVLAEQSLELQSTDEQDVNQLIDRHTITLKIQLVRPRRSTLLLYSSFWLLIVALTSAIVALLYTINADSSINSFHPIDISHDIINKSWTQAEDIFNTQLIPQLNSVADEELKDLRRGGSNSADEYLILRDTDANDSDLKMLKMYHHLVEIDLTNTDVTDACIPDVVDCPLLNELCLTNTFINGKCLDRLQNTRLQALKIAGCGLEDSDVERISKIKFLKTIYLDHNPNITAKGWKYLSNLPDLHRLSAVACDITDDTMATLAKIKSLKVLDLCKNDLITPNGLRHFSGNTKVFIRVAGCKNFKDRSLKDLAEQYDVSLEGLPI